MLSNDACVAIRRGHVVTMAVPSLIDANWTEICAILDTGNACGGSECERLCHLIEEGMQHFSDAGNAPDTLPISVDNCTRIYAALHDRYCNG